MTDDAYALDKRRLRVAFARATGSYDESAVLQAEIGRRLLERLDYVHLDPRRVLDAGAGTGRGSRALRERYRRAEIVALDIAQAMLCELRRRSGGWRERFRRTPAVCADVERLPLADGCIDLIHSNVALQWSMSLDAVFGEFRRVLAPGGLLMFTTFGPDTLRELRAAWAEVDDRVHVHAFADMHDIGDALLRAGFSDPVVDREDIVLTYGDVKTLMQDLRQIGATNAAVGRGRGLMTPRRLRALEQAYARRRDRDGRLPATYEVIYGHAWCPRPMSVNARPVIPIRPVSG
ncbi:MAG: malonyl-ACP O-methyltransferase BioC [Ectothiorhodospiraceae bacterium]|jgi:malonyl-CoA O-methyltransferase|nr:malonyl-ACP O-methyltransferase BioC [Ectothiorhodospiraceae bacterium]